MGISVVDDYPYLLPHSASEMKTPLQWASFKAHLFVLRQTHKCAALKGDVQLNQERQKGAFKSNLGIIMAGSDDEDLATF